MNQQTLRAPSPHGGGGGGGPTLRRGDGGVIATMLNEYVAQSRGNGDADIEKQQPQHITKRGPMPQSLSTSSGDESKTRPIYRRFSRCSLITIGLLCLSIIILGVLLINLNSRIDVLSDRVTKHDTLHSSDLNTRSYDAVVPSLQPVAAATSYGAKALDNVRNMLHGRAPETQSTGVSEFDRLLPPQRLPVVGNVPEKSLNTEITVSHDANALTPADLTRLFGFEVHHHEFAVWDTTPSSGTHGLRVPEEGGITYLALDRLLSFSVCCRVEVYLSTCPSADQISTIVYRNPDNEDENYLRVLVRNQVYFGKPCVFYWVQRPHENVPVGSSKLQLASASEKTS